MLMTLTLLSVVSRIPLGISLYHPCIPNSQFRLNGRLCTCDALGRWTEGSCQPSRRHTCTPGQIIWEDCKQCICQENGHLACANICTDDTKLSHITKAIDVSGHWCIPYVSYYVNCSLCVCPASAKLNEARCTVDPSCPFQGSTDYLASIKSNVCIPKVTYVFPCLRCLCSDDGFFVIRKCVETCQKTARADEARRCPPRTFFRKGCNICYCPDNGIVDDQLCSKSECVGVQFQPLDSLRNKSRRCLRQMFTSPKCFYCECGYDGMPNEKACLETDCMSIESFKHGSEKSKCSPGEMVAKCMNCFCLRNGITDPKYCTKTCSNQHKLAILENAIKDSFVSRHIVDRKNILDSEGDVCEPNSIYKEEGRYCLCSETGETSLKLCTLVFTETSETNAKINLRGSTVTIDFKGKCDPNTFVEFDCNSCYCPKSGQIDPKWCTYDDCAVKRLTMENNRINFKPADSSITECVPGSMSKQDCNFCICPESGQYKERVCTKNSCAGVKPALNELICEPLGYYVVDCNICYCPKNGIKNIDKCTKHICEKNFLRTEACVPGRLFSDECNVCVCPPNGSKANKICTNNTCEDYDTPWKKIFKLSQSLLSYQVDDATRNLELCFPGEEFEVGCKVCLCPDMGLRVYATCTDMLCSGEKIHKEVIDEAGSTTLVRNRRNDEECMIEVDSKNIQKACTPGSMYIIRCQQCICPYMGSIIPFCRPLPQGTYCEQAFPYVDYVPMGRRTEEVTEGNTTTTAATTSHKHTIWRCDKPGRVMDECFICECVNDIIVQEHCFRSNSTHCDGANPTFLLDYKLP